MRYVIAVIEVLLALAFFATVVSQIASGAFGAINLASDLILIVLGLWLAKKALANIKAQRSMRQA